MTIGSKEHDEMIKNFERNIQESVFGIPCDFRKEPYDMHRKGQIYCNGEVNRAWKIWQLGYSAARCEYLN